MKRKLIITIVSIVLLACIAVAVTLIFRGKEEPQQSTNEGTTETQLTEKANWLTVDTLSKLEELAKEINVSIEYDVEDAYVSTLPFGDGDAFYAYKFDSEKNITGLNIGYVVVASKEENETYRMDDIDAEQLSARVKTLFDWISEFLKVQIGNEFYIITDEGEILPPDETASFQHIIDGTAFLELRILDVDGSVWVLNMELAGAYNIIYCTFEHCPSDSDAAKIPCNVAIEQ